MTKEMLLEILEEYQNDTQILYQDNNNINKYLPISGVQVITHHNGKRGIVLLTNKRLQNELRL